MPKKINATTPETKPIATPLPVTVNKLAQLEAKQKEEREKLIADLGKNFTSKFADVSKEYQALPPEVQAEIFTQAENIGILKTLGLVVKGTAKETKEGNSKVSPRIPSVIKKLINASPDGLTLDELKASQSLSFWEPEKIETITNGLRCHTKGTIESKHWWTLKNGKYCTITAEQRK